MPVSLNLKPFIATAMLTTILASCSAFEPEYSDCPSIKAVLGADDINTRGILHKQDVTARINGHTARCVATNDGVEMELELGLMLKRDFAQGFKVEEVPIDVALAFVDENDQPVGRITSRQTAFFPDYKDKSRPIFSINIDVPANTRVLIGISHVYGEE